MLIIHTTGLSQPQPYDNFEWFQVNNNIIKHILNLNENITDAYILYAYMEYPMDV